MGSRLRAAEARHCGTGSADCPPAADSSAVAFSYLGSENKEGNGKP